MPVAGAEQGASLASLSSDRAFTSGLGIGAGLGGDNVWLGGHLIYYLQAPSPKLRVALHVGAGLVPMHDPQSALPNPSIEWGVRGGGFLSYGKRHRLVLGMLGGTMGWETFSLHWRSLSSMPLYGAALSVGYEYMSEGGFYFRSTIGPGLQFYRSTSFYDRREELVWRGNLISLGYKLW